ncbi:hypothetical protein ATX23_09440 [Oenococcus oeni]|uniref:hypothetical protein n=1 Tax=Oenococcus oeni TaxID=1247 RepID=UPI0008F85B77|nr:hypothetical protein [Oenococcus oeni]OIL58320.1 hypothetical protein ATX23_09440 [Oenococcus oeni]
MVGKQLSPEFYAELSKHMKPENYPYFGSIYSWFDNENSFSTKLQTDWLVERIGLQEQADSLAAAHIGKNHSVAHIYGTKKYCKDICKMEIKSMRSVHNNRLKEIIKAVNEIRSF